MLAASMLCLACMVGLAGCTIVGTSDATRAAIEAADPATVHVVVYRGADGLGLVDFMDKASQGELHNRFRCVASSSAGPLIESLRQGKVDIAVVPTALALNIYQGAPEDVQVASIASLGGLHVVSGHKGLKGLEDLAGATILMTGQGTMDEYVVRYLLAQKELTDQVTLQFVGKPSDVVAALSTDHDAIGILAEPYVTAARFKDKKLRARIDLSDVWAEVVGDDSRIVSGVALVRTAFAESHPEAVAEFLDAQRASIEAYDDDPDVVAQLVADMGLVDSLEIAEAALPSCSMACVTGERMRELLTSFLQTIYDFNPAWAGGDQGIPAESFYYEVELVDESAEDADADTDEDATDEAAEDAAAEGETTEEAAIEVVSE